MMKKVAEINSIYAGNVGVDQKKGDQKKGERGKKGRKCWGGPEKGAFDGLRK